VVNPLRIGNLIANSQVQNLDLPKTERPRETAAGDDAPFGVNAMRLGPRLWLTVLAIVVGCGLAVPRVWKRIERFDVASDYRIPYTLSNDYWLYQWRLERISDPASVPVLGDSVVWGEYVRPDGTLSHFLNREAGRPERFVNCGVNGLFPLALEGLIEHYGAAMRNRKLLLHCNVLWMSSPKADLSVAKEESFNHARLVPQFSPRIPCYRAGAVERLSAVIDRSVDLFGWVEHVNNVYFDQRSIPAWTLEEDGGDPPHYPNAWRNPLARITLRVPGDPPDDPERGPRSPRHKPWTEGGVGTSQLDWVALDASLQWAAFQRLVARLKERGNDVLVILGPFNEHMLAEDDRPAFRKIRDGISRWLDKNRVPRVTPEPLPSARYADASHPLTEGYELLAKRLYQDRRFREWLR
jgi:hypothetical protein